MAELRLPDPNQPILPVIHIAHAELSRPRFLALENAQVVDHCGAGAMWLIDHFNNHRPEILVSVAEAVREKFPHLWIGVNFLGLPPKVALEMVPEGIDGLWLDDGGINLQNVDYPDYGAREVQVLRNKTHPSVSIWGGVAFKYKQDVPEGKQQFVAQIAAERMDVVVTSGTATGSAPSTRKIQRMASSVGQVPLANASGTDEDNVQALRESGVQFFLVASSICDRQENILPGRLKRLIEAAA